MCRKFPTHHPCLGFPPHRGGRALDSAVLIGEASRDEPLPDATLLGEAIGDEALGEAILVGDGLEDETPNIKSIRLEKVGLLELARAVAGSAAEELTPKGEGSNESAPEADGGCAVWALRMGSLDLYFTPTDTGALKWQGTVFKEPSLILVI
ncbi:hypothetical protein HAX54_021452 [Datura stramonium]|uniref:Uncharacterized protein n=1 Tax=Datura stramonium TaxID=4076 RepID=A0ABS8USR4_DATST|nr:hypothetical protein [Datura stramonium]